jgi:tetrahydromethanopterin S-methyltransferase subunit B
VYNALVALWARIKSNQLEVIDLAVGYIKDVETCMVRRCFHSLVFSLMILSYQMQGLDAEAEQLLEQLSNVASGRPGNVLAARALVRSYPENNMS